MSGPLLLSIESSCDETGIALVEGGRRILSNVVASQVALHAPTGGIVPELAARAHLRWIVPTLDEAWSGAGVDWRDIDGIAVTYGPGLAGSLLVGINFAKALSWVHDVPLIGVNHLEGHVYAAWLLDPGEDETTKAQPIFPLVALIVSGGHTFIAEMTDHLTYRLLGTTVDDAAGEAFDKIASLLGLPYPGGPAIERAARNGDPAKHRFPRPLLDEAARLDFSFSGLKTAVRYAIAAPGETISKTLTAQEVADIAASFQEAAIDCLVGKAELALEQTGYHYLCVGGGVAANGRFRERLETSANLNGYELFIPPLSLCTDNAVMGAIAIERLRAGKVEDLSLDISPGPERGHSERRGSSPPGINPAARI